MTNIEGKIVLVTWTEDDVKSICEQLGYKATDEDVKRIANESAASLETWDDLAEMIIEAIEYETEKYFES